MAGKGDKPRPIDKGRYGENYDNIFKPRMKLIAAMSRNNIIGNGPDIPWHISSDLKRFKKLTTGSVVVMGRKTFESIGKPLPNRVNVVLSRNPNPIPGCEVYSSAEEVANKYKDAWVIGGGEIYKLFIPYISEMYITRVHKEFDGDVYFPVDDFDKKYWKVTDSRYCTEVDVVPYSFEKYVKTKEVVDPPNCRAFLPTIIEKW